MADWQVGDTFRILEDCDFYGIDPYRNELYVITYRADEPEGWPDDWEGEWEYPGDDYYMARIHHLGDDPYDYDPCRYVMTDGNIEYYLDGELIELVDGPSYYGKKQSKICPYCQGKIETCREPKMRVCSECFRKIEE